VISTRPKLQKLSPPRGIQKLQLGSARADGAEAVVELTGDRLRILHFNVTALPLLCPLKSVSELRYIAQAYIREFRSPDSIRSANCLSFAVDLRE
jgi:hypothetical protein